MAETKPMFEKGRLELGLQGNVEIPSLGAAKDGRIYCVFSQDIKTIWLVATNDGGKVGCRASAWEKPSRVMGCPGPGYITDANVLACAGRVTVYATYVDNSQKTWRSQFLASTTTDNGKTWSSPVALPIASEGEALPPQGALADRGDPTAPLRHRYVVGKIHTPVWLDDKTVVMGYSWDLHADQGKAFGDEGGMRIKSGVLISQDGGLAWAPGSDVPDIAHPFGLDEPAIVRLGNGDIFMILRTATPFPCETRSRDGGKTWEAPKPSKFCAYNSPTALLRLKDGAILRAWDNSHINRFPLVVALSTDDGETWSPPRTITEPTLDAQGKANFERACYPSLAEGPDGTILAVWWERTVEGVNSLGYARFNRAWVEEARTLPPPRVIVTFGDSLTAAIGRCGVRTCQTYSFLLEARLKAAGLNVQVWNAGVGGNDTRHGLARLERDVLAHRPEIVTVLFGGNDAAMVDGGPVARTEPRVPLTEYRSNLVEIVKRIQAAGARVVLCTSGPMTRAYAHAKIGAYATCDDMNFMLKHYAAAAREVAAETGAPLVDIFSAVAGNADADRHAGRTLAMWQDGIHPNAAGQALITEMLLGPVRSLLQARPADK